MRQPISAEMTIESVKANSEKNMKLFDSHAHYYDERFDTEYEGGADALLPKLFSSDIGWIINVSTNNENAELCISQARKYEGMYAAVGIHPTDCQAYNDTEYEISRLRTIIDGRKDKKIVAIGEIGLDYHYDDTDKEKQKEFFIRQMQLAEELSLPVFIHDRDAHGDCMDIVRLFPNVKGVFHSYTGSIESAKELLKMGWYISFSGVITFKNASKVKEVAAFVPTDRLLLETDCPYLAPHPHRGELNHSGLMHFTLEEQARLHNIPADELAVITERNARVLFGL